LTSSRRSSAIPCCARSTVPRSALIERLAGGDPGPIVSVVAPAGYGKTTLLAQWAERNGQAFAWVSVDASSRSQMITRSRELGLLEG
jgi:LuxR family transcriptional regulator, maltose regulon positive regulatory protein